MAWPPPAPKAAVPDGHRSIRTSGKQRSCWCRVGCRRPGRPNRSAWGGPRSTGNSRGKRVPEPGAEGRGQRRRGPQRAPRGPHSVVGGRHIIWQTPLRQYCRERGGHLSFSATSHGGRHMAATEGKNRQKGHATLCGRTVCPLVLYLQRLRENLRHIIRRKSARI